VGYRKACILRTRWSAETQTKELLARPGLPGWYMSTQTEYMHQTRFGAPGSKQTWARGLEGQVAKVRVAGERGSSRDSTLFWCLLLHSIAGVNTPGICKMSAHRLLADNTILATLLTLWPLVCDRTFGSDEALQQHVRDSPAHAPCFDCEACDRSFGSERVLEQALSFNLRSVLWQRRHSTAAFAGLARARSISSL